MPSDPTGLLDTSVAIDPMVCEPESLPTTSCISAVSLAELSVGPLVARTDDDKNQRQHVLQLAESTFDRLPFDVACARHFDGIAGLTVRRASGNQGAGNRR